LHITIVEKYYCTKLVPITVTSSNEWMDDNFLVYHKTTKQVFQSWAKRLQLLGKLSAAVR